MVERPSRVLAALVGHAWLPVALAFAALGGGAGALVSPSFELTGAASTVGAPLVPSALEVDPPVVVGPTLTPSSLMRGDIVTVSASATDATGVAGISLSTGDWPWIPMSSGDGAWGGLAEDASATIGGPAARVPT